MTATAKKRPRSAPLTVVSEDEQHEKARVASLTALIAELKAPPAKGGAVDKDDFARLFHKAQRILELDDTEVARALQISRPTVGRWARGESAPHALGRKPALQWLAKQAGHKLLAHDA